MLTFKPLQLIYWRKKRRRKTLGTRRQYKKRKTPLFNRRIVLYHTANALIVMPYVPAPRHQPPNLACLRRFVVVALNQEVVRIYFEQQNYFYIWKPPRDN